jgi:metallo-beta-lactamase class B
MIAGRTRWLLSLLLVYPALTGAAPEPEEIVLAEDLVVRRLTEDVWLHISHVPLDGKPARSNGVIVEAEGAALVVDTAWTDRQTGRLLDWIENDRGLKVRHLIVTHFHDDRMGGIREAHRRGIPTYGSVRTAELARAEGNPPPQIRFSESITIDFGDEIVEARFPGPGHSPDNIVVWLADRGILAGGCMVRNARTRNLGYTGVADLEAWPDSIRRLQQLQPATVVPGHGSPGGAELLEATLTLLASYGVDGGAPSPDNEPTQEPRSQDAMSQSEHDRRIDYIEFPVPDVAAARRFYETVFGWKFTDYGPDYSSFEDGRLTGGFRVDDAVPGGPLVVLYVVDLEAMQARIVEHGGIVIKKIFEFPGGRRFHFRDPSGHELAVWSDS